MSHKIFVHTEENATLLGAMKTATGCRVTNIKNYIKGIHLKQLSTYKGYIQKETFGVCLQTNINGKSTDTCTFLLNTERS